MVALSHDAFARTTFHREAIPKTHVDKQLGCNSCGGLNRHKGLYRYWHESDAAYGMGQLRPNGKRFCSVGCFRSYYA